MDELSGTLAQVRYHNGDFLIGVLDSGHTVKGAILTPQVGRAYRFFGRWENHSQWGPQFAFQDFTATAPATEAAIRSYLMENVRGVGVATANTLIERYGGDTLRICKDDPGRVAAEVPAVSLQKAQRISEALREVEATEARELRLKELFAGTHVGRRPVNQIIALYGADAVRRIEEDPYGLIGEIAGIGFETADVIARCCGTDLEAPSRIRAGVAHILKETAQSGGHTCLPGRELLDAVTQLLGVSEHLIVEQLKEQFEEGELILDDEKRVGLRHYYQCERQIGEKLLAILDNPAPERDPDVSDLMPDQVEAIRTAVKHSVFVLTGAPGVGKTYTIRRILSTFPDLEIALGAPTGRAAKRIEEQTGRPASTIHRLLQPQPSPRGGFVFARNEQNPIDADLIVLDEVSMIDVSLMAAFLLAVKPTTRLILVGDHYQLPSVGPGNILRDLIQSQQIPFCELTIIKRQDEGLIVRNCHAVKSGRPIDTSNDPAGDFFFIEKDSEERIRETVLDLVARRLPTTYDLDPLADIMVISPRRSKVGLACDSLNPDLQDLLNPSPPLDRIRFRVGDRVIQTRNDYQLGVMNGDLGRVQAIDNPTGSGSADTPRGFITVRFDNPPRAVRAPLYENDLELAYALTVHKCQGSEFEAVVMPIHSSFGCLVMQRNLLYTAISRARRLCVLVGQKDQVSKMISRNAPLRRHTRLRELLVELGGVQ